MMWFRKLTVEGYGRFREPVEFHFQPGLNIIVGPNEAGKTTLLSALLDAIYESPFSTAKPLRQSITWNHSDGWRLQLEIQAGARTFTLYKYYPPDSKSNSTRVILSMDDQQLTDKLALQHWEECWGVPKPVYLATACVRQREIASLLQDKPVTELQASLRASATTADLKQVYKMLDDRVKQLKTSRDNELKRIETRIRELQRQFDDAQRVYTDRRDARERLRRLNTQAAELDKQIQEMDALLKLWAKVQDYRKKLDDLRRIQKDLHERFEQLERIDKRIDDIAQELEDFQHFISLPDDLLEQCARIEERLKLSQQNKEQIEAEIQNLRHHAEKFTGKQKAIPGLGVLGASLLLAVIPLWQVDSLLAAAVGVMGGMALAIAFLFRKSDPAVAAQMGSLQQRLQDTRQETAQAQDELTRLLRKAGFEGESLDTEITLLRAQWDQYQDLLREQQNVLHERQGLLAGSTPHAWRDELRSNASALMALEEELKKPAASAILNEPPDRFIRMENEIATVRQQHTDMHEERLRLEGQLTQLHDLPDPEEFSLQIEELQTQHRSLARQAEVAELTRQLLRETDEQYLGTLESYLTPEIERVLSATTGKRYGRVRMGGDLSFTAYHPERENWLPLEMSERAWSAGTLDQLFFACRLGLCRALSGQRSLPLLLDDPFVHYDPIRLSKTVEFLSALGQECQILWFTCRQVEDTNRSHIVSLGE